MEILSSGVVDLSCSLSRCAEMISRSHPRRTRPSATSLSWHTRSTSSWDTMRTEDAMRTEMITSAMMVEKSKTDFFVCVSILFVCKIRFRFFNFFFVFVPMNCTYFSRTFPLLFTYFFRTFHVLFLYFVVLFP